MEHRNFSVISNQYTEDRMRDQAFFSQITQQSFTAENYHFCAPAFYYDTTQIQINFMAPTKSVKALLPSPRLFPLRVTFNNTLVIISAYQYRDSDIGPYNEVAIVFPVTLDKPTLPFLGISPFMRDPVVYIWQLPVTTPIALYGGVEFYNFPKFIADIDFEEVGDRVQFRLAEGDHEIFTMNVRKISGKPKKRSRINALSLRSGRILRTEVISSESNGGSSSRKEDIQFSLGDHPIADALRKLPLGAISSYEYIPKIQAILTSPIESYPSS